MSRSPALGCREGGGYAPPSHAGPVRASVEGAAPWGAYPQPGGWGLGPPEGGECQWTGFGCGACVGQGSGVIRTDYPNNLTRGEFNNPLCTKTRAGWKKAAGGGGVVGPRAPGYLRPEDAGRVGRGSRFLLAARRKPGISGHFRAHTAARAGERGREGGGRAPGAEGRPEARAPPGPQGLPPGQGRR